MQKQLNIELNLGMWPLLIWQPLSMPNSTRSIMQTIDATLQIVTIEVNVLATSEEIINYDLMILVLPHQSKRPSRPLEMHSSSVFYTNLSEL